MSSSRNRSRHPLTNDWKPPSTQVPKTQNAGAAVMALTVRRDKQLVVSQFEFPRWVESGHSLKALIYRSKML
jgi:hypothetical protein